MFETLESRGFSPRWLKTLKSLLNKGSVGVRINDVNSEFFLTGKGVRQVMACKYSPLGTPRGRYDEHSSKYSLSCETKV
jgi:hypothetical protein